ncbi:hypothetical protein SESBI_10670 [Sesbania bispinosa]|nr:hypothetical protein SESBI_10670 [Sesbania bispinosa]
MGKDLTFCAFTWTHREGNAVAHHVASECFHGSLPPQWPLAPPAPLRDLLAADVRSMESVPHRSTAHAQPTVPIVTVWDSLLSSLVPRPTVA